MSKYITDIDASMQRVHLEVISMYMVYLLDSLSAVAIRPCFFHGPIGASKLSTYIYGPCIASTRIHQKVPSRGPPVTPSIGWRSPLSKDSIAIFRWKNGKSRSYIPQNPNVASSSHPSPRRQPHHPRSTNIVASLVTNFVTLNTSQNLLHPPSLTLSHHISH